MQPSCSFLAVNPRISAFSCPLLPEICCALQVHISLAGSARVLLNTQKLPGITKKASMLAEREVKYSTPEVDKQRGLDNSTRQSLDSQSAEETEPQHPSTT